MLPECLEGLNIQEQGIYVDATFGGGGHSKEILKRIDSGKLIAFDQDIDASKEAENISNRSFTFYNANFRFISRYLRLGKVEKVDGILADLGISSHQIDTPERGFSIRYDSSLDMRMDKSSKISAMEIINEYSESDLRRILSLYGEVEKSNRVAREIVRVRSQKPIVTTGDLISAISSFARRGKENTFLAKVFQALRLEVNDEINALTDFLTQCKSILKPGGRLVIMSYHSLEDRLVKNLIRTGNTEGILNKDFYGNIECPYEQVTRKPLIASESEVKINKRARSAKLRIAIRKKDE